MLQQTNSEEHLSIKERLYHYSLLFFAVLLPFQFTSLPLTLGLMFFSLIWLVSLDFGSKFSRMRGNVPSYLALLYFIWVALGMLYSPDPVAAERILVLKIPFAAWAILMASTALKADVLKRLILQGFMLAMTVASLLALGQYLYAFLVTGNAIGESPVKLLQYYNVPPHYFGLYLNFAYALVLTGLIRTEYLLSQKWLSLLSLVSFLSVLILLAVRMQYLVFIIVNLAVAASYIRRSGKVSSVVLLLLPLVVLVAGMLLLPGPRGRIMDGVNELVSFRKMVNDKQTNPRKYLWRYAWEVIRERPLIGTGTGAEDAALHEWLKEEKARFWNGHTHFTLADTSYNYHNSYLQHWAAHGLIGLGLLLAMFIQPLFRRRSETGVLFLLVCAVSFLTESMLQRQAGVLFFSFFYAILFILPDDDADRESRWSETH